MFASCRYHCHIRLLLDKLLVRLIDLALALLRLDPLMFYFGILVDKELSEALVSRLRLLQVQAELFAQLRSASFQ